jgi:hypothetical protein
MQVHPKIHYTLEVTRPELRLIGLALAGKLRPNSNDAREALDLNLKLLEAQAHELSEELNRIDGALVCVKDEQQKPGSPVEP